MGTVIRICALTATLFVAASFLLFAVDQMSEGSENQVRKLADDGTRAKSQATIDEPAPAPAVERIREAEHSAVREYIDDANDVLLSPFNALVESDEVWFQRLVPGVLALLIYGFGGMVLANSLPGRNRTGGDWRQPVA